jgi:magnesium-transporting ATPase (P-type)
MLQQRGIRVHMLTGDNMRTARAVAQKVFPLMLYDWPQEPDSSATSNSLCCILGRHRSSGCSG